jgi:protein-S-isoprenylcysteine O-methyltransferase Ste14
MTLGAKAWGALALLAIAMAALIFVPARTVDYWQAWVYLTIFFGAAAVTTQDLIRRDPALLERRMRGGPTAEKRPTQRIIMFFTSLGFAALMIVPALDRHAGWSDVPLFLVLVGDAMVVVGFYFIFLVYRENSFTSATIDIVAEQRIVTTGPYAIVRHPMYAGALIYLAGTPLALASFWGFVPFVVIFAALLLRLFDEERLLREELPGYVEYQQQVRHRLVPGIW